MNNMTSNAARQLPQQAEHSTAAEVHGATATDAAPIRNRIAPTMRSRSKMLRIAPPIDDGFRPFRVF